MIVPRTAVFVDADNTLWDTDQVFAAAQLAALDSVASALGNHPPNENDRLAFVRAADQAIAARHHAGLRYPPRLLARALAFALDGRDSEAAARDARLGVAPSLLSSQIETDIEREFSAAINRLPKLRDGVREGLVRLQTSGTLTLVITEAARARVASMARQLDIADTFSRIVEGQKRPDLYRRVLRLLPPQTKAFMIGDQLDRDIAPAKAAGLTTIYFPGGFLPRWTPDEAKVGPDFQVKSFLEAVEIVIAE